MKPFSILYIFLILLFAHSSLQAFDTENLDPKELSLVDSLQRYVEQYAQTSPDDVLKFAEKMETMASKSKYKLLEARALNAQASVYYYKKDNKKAARYFEKELSILEKLGNVNELADSYFNLATLYFSINKMKDAAEYYEKSLDLVRKKGDKEMELQLLERLALTYEKLEKYKQAFGFYQQYVNINEEKKTQQVENEFFTLRSKISEEKAQSEQLIKKKEKEIKQKSKEIKQKEKELVVTQVAKDSLSKDVEKKSEKITSLHIDNIQKQFTIQEKEKQVAEQRRMIYKIVAGLAILVLFFALLYSQYKAKIKANRLLEQKNAEIMQQKEEIEAQRDEIEAQRDFISRQNQDIKDSIHYAKQIQTALMPEFKFSNKVLKDSFLWFNPRDIVSGDFYWCTESDTHMVVAAADCTGHGVPGAFMSMLGMAYLDEVVIKGKEYRPNKIIDAIRDGIIKSLKQHGLANQSKDGMDITVVSVDLQKKTIQYSGANNPIYVMRNDELIEYKGDRMPASVYPKMEPFTMHEFDIVPGMWVYMFSDGFADQFGGPDGGKFKYKPFKRLLESNHKMKADVQRSIIEQTFNEWKSNNYQVDDNLVLGLKF